MKYQILTEAQVLDEARLTKNKLQNMKDHLENLLRKRIRIESEIQLLKKAIKDKEKNFCLKIKTGVQLESSEAFLTVTETTDHDFELSGKVPGEIFTELLELCQVTNEIQSLYQSFSVEAE